jgi:AAA15 family ATPase/GTPase
VDKTLVLDGTLKISSIGLTDVMILKRIEIKGLRGFENEGIINLANPDGTYGSGLTILVGPNNSGKSTIIEAFSALSSSFSETFKNPSFTEEMRNKKRRYDIDKGYRSKRWFF